MAYDRSVVGAWQAHRTGITAADSAEPTNTTNAIDLTDYEYADIEVFHGDSSVSCDIQILVWNDKKSAYTPVGKYTIADTSTVKRIRVPALGYLYVYVPSVSGTFTNGFDIYVRGVSAV